MSAPIFTPQIPNFLAIAQQAAEQRRQAEMDRLNQLRAAESRSNEAFHSAMDMVEKGVPYNTIIQNSPGLLATHAALLKEIEKKKKEQETQKPTADFLQKNAEQIAQFPDAAKMVESQGLSPDAANPILQLIQAQQQIGPAIAAANEIAAQQEFARKRAQEEALAQDKARVDIAAQRQKDTNKAAIKELFDSRRLATEGVIHNVAYDAVFGGKPVDVQSNPVLRSVPYAADRVAIEQRRLISLDKPFEDAKKELADLGAPVDQIPDRAIKGWMTGTDSNGNQLPQVNFLSARTKLLIPVTQQDKIQPIEASLSQLDNMQAVIEMARDARAASGKNLSGWRQRKDAIENWLRVKIRDGYAAGDLSMIEAMRQIGATPLARSIGGIKGADTEGDVERALAALPNTLEVLSSDPSLYLGRLTAARSGALSQLRTQYGSYYKESLYTKQLKNAQTSEVIKAKLEFSQILGLPPRLTEEERLFIGVGN
jgi:hypothetical protein